MKSAIIILSILLIISCNDDSQQLLDAVLEDTESNDSDGDGVEDDMDSKDSDGDGVEDNTENTDNTDPLNNCSFVITSQTLTPNSEWEEADCDSDGLTNAEEIQNDTDLLKSDTDDDGIFDGTEITNGTDPLENDTDGDGVSDGNENIDDTNPLNNCSFKLTNQSLIPDSIWSNGDCDNDTVINSDEIINGTNPQKEDTDGDGVSDGNEISNNTDPLNNCSFILSSQTLTPDSAWLNADCDSDGITNEDEIAGGTNPQEPNGNETPLIVKTWGLVSATIDDGTATTIFQGQSYNLTYTSTSSNENIEVIFSENPSKVQSSGTYTSILNFNFLGQDYSENINSESPLSEGDWQIINDDILEIISNDVVTGSYEILELTDNSLKVKVIVDRVLPVGGVDLNTKGTLILSFTKKD